jgi:hypothetical protein
MWIRVEESFDGAQVAFSSPTIVECTRCMTEANLLVMHVSLNLQQPNTKVQLHFNINLLCPRQGKGILAESERVMRAKEGRIPVLAIA